MRRSSSRRRLIAATFAAAGALSAGSAQAQSFFQSLFGGGAPAPALAPQVRVIPPASLNAQSQFRERPSPAVIGQERADRPARHAQSNEGRGGGYRTVCVRTCDGYYWPISSSVSRSHFYKDANACRASCGSDAKLYYQGASETDAKGLVDLQGRPYSRLQSAFLYRKSLVEGCACKPEPWSQAELDRHAGYAVAAGMVPTSTASESPMVAEVVAGGSADAKPDAATRAVEPETRPAAPTAGKLARSKVEVASRSGAPVSPPSPAEAAGAARELAQAGRDVAPAPAPVSAAVASVSPERAQDVAQAAPADQQTEPLPHPQVVPAEPATDPTIASLPAALPAATASRPPARTAARSKPQRHPVAQAAKKSTGHKQVAQHAAPAKAVAKHPARNPSAPQLAKAPVKPPVLQSAALIGGPSKYTWPGDSPTKYR